MSEDKRHDNGASSGENRGCGGETMPEAAGKNDAEQGKDCGMGAAPGRANGTGKAGVVGADPNADSTADTADGVQAATGAAGTGAAGTDTGEAAACDDNETLAQLEAQLQDIDPRDTEIAQLKDDLAHAQADFLNLQNEYGKYVRRAKAEAPALRAVGHVEVAQSLLSVLDDIQAARDAGDLADGPFAAIATKLESTLESRFAIARFGTVGEEFNPHLHEALMSQTSAEVQVATVGQVLQPGYRIGERVLRAAKVLVLNPAE